MESGKPDAELIPLMLESAVEMGIDLPDNFESAFRSDLGRIVKRFETKGGFFRKVSAIPGKTLAEYPPCWVASKLESAARAISNAHKAAAAKLKR